MNDGGKESHRPGHSLVRAGVILGLISWAVLLLSRGDAAELSFLLTPLALCVSGLGLVRAWLGPGWVPGHRADLLWGMAGTIFNAGTLLMLVP